MSNEPQISRATDFVEQLLDKVIRPHQDWAEVKRLALALAELADDLAQAEADDPGSLGPESRG